MRYPPSDRNTDVEKRLFAAFSASPIESVSFLLGPPRILHSNLPSTPLPSAWDEQLNEDELVLYSALEENHPLGDSRVEQELTDDEVVVNVETDNLDESEADDPFAEFELVKYSPRCDGNREGCLPCSRQISSAFHDDPFVNRTSSGSFDTGDATNQMDSESDYEIEPSKVSTNEVYADPDSFNVDSRDGLLSDEVEVLEHSMVEQGEVGSSKWRRIGFPRERTLFTRGLVDRFFRRKEAEGGPGEQGTVRLFMLSGELGNANSEEIIDSKGKVRRREETRDLPSRRFPDRQ